MSPASSIECVDNSQRGWRIQSSTIDLFITELGGHMAPVRFDIGGPAPVQPYYISPWQNENIPDIPAPVLVPLRGDFFCMPFGGNAEAVNGESHPVHGEVATAPWRFVDAQQADGLTALVLEMQTGVHKGKVTKKIFLRDGHNAIYSTHVLEDYDWATPLGHHCTLDLPEDPGSVRVSVGSFEFGMTAPTLFSNPENREYQSFAIGERFSDLTRVPLLWKNPAHADCTSFPQRVGFTDLLQVLKKPGDHPSWTVMTCPSRGYLWFSLKDAAVLPSTVFWISNKGRHGSPWNGRNRCLGLEETCSHFADGLAQSLRPNCLSETGIPTVVTLTAGQPTAVHFIQGVAPIPADFERVQEVVFENDILRFISTAGQDVAAPVTWKFLQTGQFNNKSQS